MDKIRETQVEAKQSHWCILRTAAPRTIALYRSLTVAGYDAWTPVDTIQRRRPRSKIIDDIEIPILPTFLFVRGIHLPDLHAIPWMVYNPHPSFSIFHYGGRIPLVADREIDGLRRREESARLAQLKRKRHSFEPGQRVRVDDGSFTGMSGVIEDGDGKFAMVAFGGRWRVKIATWLLSAEGGGQR